MCLFRYIFVLTNQAYMSKDKSILFKKGDVFKTPSGLIKIVSLAKETNKHGSGYKIGAVVVSFDDFHKYVKEGVWVKQ